MLSNRFIDKIGHNYESGRAKNVVDSVRSGFNNPSFALIRVDKLFIRDSAAPIKLDLLKIK